MAKHNSYSNPANITITKHSTAFGDAYDLVYAGEDWQFTGSLGEVLEELREHLENMVQFEQPRLKNV